MDSKNYLGEDELRALPKGTVAEQNYDPGYGRSRRWVKGDDEAWMRRPESEFPAHDYVPESRVAAYLNLTLVDPLILLAEAGECLCLTRLNGSHEDGCAKADSRGKQKSLT